MKILHVGHLFKQYFYVVYHKIYLPMINNGYLSKLINLNRIKNKKLFSRNEFVYLDQSSILNTVQWNKQNKIHFLICNDLIRSIKGPLIGKYCTLITDIVLLFFGIINDTCKLNDYQIILPDKNLFKLRTKLNTYIKRKLQSLGCDKDKTNDYYSFNLLVKILSTIE